MSQSHAFDISKRDKITDEQYIMLNIENHFSNRNTCALREGHDFYIIHTIFIYIRLRIHTCTQMHTHTHTYKYISIHVYGFFFFFYFATIETLLLLFNSESIEGIARLMMPISWATERRAGRYTNTVMATAPGSQATHVERNSTEKKKSDSQTAYTHTHNHARTSICTQCLYLYTLTCWWLSALFCAPRSERYGTLTLTSGPLKSVKWIVTLIYTRGLMRKEKMRKPGLVVNESGE